MNIKIFVSNRIDIKSTQINNSIYTPVQCGAVFSKDKSSDMLGDNTGDNISQKRNSFCEFTVQYWAWKNCHADYYGLCHYRRFLTFSTRQFKANVQEQIQEPFLDLPAIKKYDLTNVERMKQVIEKNDVIVNQAADVTQISTPQGFQKTVYGHWAGHDQVFLDKRVLPLFVEVIRSKFPQYYEAAEEYLAGKWHRGYNCYVMKRNLFQAMCEFQFGVMFEMEKILANTSYTKGMERTVGYLGEIMYGIYILFAKTKSISD